MTMPSHLLHESVEIIYSQTLQELFVDLQNKCQNIHQRTFQNRISPMCRRCAAVTEARRHNRYLTMIDSRDTLQTCNL